MSGCDRTVSCCGIGELHGIEFDNSPEETIRLFLGEYCDTWNIVIFTDGKPRRKILCNGEKLATYIRKNRLGKVHRPYSKEGLNGYPVKLWVWYPNWKALARLEKKWNISDEEESLW